MDRLIYLLYSTAIKYSKSPQKFWQLLKEKKWQLDFNKAYNENNWKRGAICTSCSHSNQIKSNKEKESGELTEKQEVWLIRTGQQVEKR